MKKIFLNKFDNNIEIIKNVKGIEKFDHDNILSEYYFNNGKIIINLPSHLKHINSYYL